MNTGSDYSDDERAFMLAMEVFKRVVSRYPTWDEVLAVAKACGWRKVDDGSKDDVGGGAGTARAWQGV